MDEDRSVPINVIAVRALEYSADAKDLVISLTTKYSRADRIYSVPLQCFYDLILDLRRLNSFDGIGVDPIRTEDSIAAE